MKYLVTMPPGGLGHFLSRVLANEYDYTISSNGSYHGLHKNYSSQTTQIEKFKQSLVDSDQQVICLHNFENLDLTKMFPDRTVVNIVVSSEWPIYFNNFFRKSIESSQYEYKKFLIDSQSRFPGSVNYLREEFFFLYRAAIQGTVPWLPQHMQGQTIQFGDFYKFETFFRAINNIQPMPEEKLLPIWNHFIQGQQPIVSRVGYYDAICRDVIAGVEPNIPDFFDNVDYGIMCGMIYVSTNRDVLNIDKDQWI